MGYWNWTPNSYPDAVFSPYCTCDRKICALLVAIHNRLGDESNEISINPALDASFHLLAQSPTLGRACDDIRDGYRKYHIGRHLIFYREASVGIEIIRILHDRMDVEAHFDED